MALIKFTAFLADVRGSVAGTVFSKNTYGAYTRTKVTPINPQTAAQSAVRQFFGQLSQSWRGLTQAQRDLWNQSASNFSRNNVFGDQVNLTGFNLYKRLNQNLLNVGQAVIANAPLPSDVFGFTGSSLVANTTAGTLVLTYAPAIPAGTSVILFATAPQSAGKKFVASEYRKIDTIVAADVSPWDMATEYIAKFGALPPVGSKVFVKVKPVNDTTGQAGTALSSEDIAV